MGTKVALYLSPGQFLGKPSWAITMGNLHLGGQSTLCHKHFDNRLQSTNDLRGTHAMRTLQTWVNLIPRPPFHPAAVKATECLPITTTRPRGLSSCPRHHCRGPCNHLTGPVFPDLLSEPVSCEQGWQSRREESEKSFGIADFFRSHPRFCLVS